MFATFEGFVSILVRFSSACHTWNIWSESQVRVKQMRPVSCSEDCFIEVCVHLSLALYSLKLTQHYMMMMVSPSFHTHFSLCCLSCRPHGGSMWQKQQHHITPVLETMHCYTATVIHCTEQVVLTALNHVCYWLILTYYLGDGWKTTLQLPSHALNVSFPIIARFKGTRFRSAFEKGLHICLIMTIPSDARL